jgi:small subunit ribosomal protein S14
MKSLFSKSFLFREKFKKFETRYLILKSIKYNCNIHPKFRWEASLLLTKLTKTCSQNFIKNRCFLTGRAGGFFRFFRLSRIQLRRLACNNELFGLRKATW